MHYLQKLVGARRPSGMCDTTVRRTGTSPDRTAGGERRQPEQVDTSSSPQAQDLTTQEGDGDDGYITPHDVQHLGVVMMQQGGELKGQVVYNCLEIVCLSSKFGAHL